MHRNRPQNNERKASDLEKSGSLLVIHEVRKEPDKKPSSPFIYKFNCY